MRELLASDDPHATQAVELFCFRCAREIAAMANSLAGFECLVFTGGIGEHAKEIRSAIGERLTWLGVRIDATANDEARERISGGDGSVDVFIIPTNEELTIARHCAAVLPRSGPAIT
jgi:acetate kinase